MSDLPAHKRPAGPAREVPAPPSARGVRTAAAVYGRDALRRVRPGTQMLRMRRFGKDRCGYDARNTGLRHNRSLPRLQGGNLRGPAWAGGSRSCTTGGPPTSRPGARSTRAALGAWRPNGCCCIQEGRAPSRPSWNADASHAPTRPCVGGRVALLRDRGPRGRARAGRDECIDPEHRFLRFLSF